jgi:CHAD domain-containing protein
VAAFKTRKLKARDLALETRLAGQRGPRLASAVTRATARAFADVVRRRRAIEPDFAATIHRTRIAFKKFRYMVESLSPDFTGFGKRELRVLGFYQRRMGILQDLEVLQHSLADFVKDHEEMKAMLKPFGRWLKARRARALASFFKSADQLFAFWPPQRAKARVGA